MPSPPPMAWVKFRVLTVMLCAASILLVLAYLLTGGSMFESKSLLYVSIPDSTGVEIGSPVRVNGILVGKVTGVRLTGSADPNRVVRVTLRIETAYLRSIPVDSYAEVSADTMIGDRFIDISSGKMARHVAANAEIPFQPPSDVFKSLDLGQFQQRIREIDTQLTAIERGRGSVGELVAGESIYDGVVRNVKELERGFAAAVGTTGQVGQALYSDRLYLEIRKPLQELDGTLARIMSGQGEGGRLLRDTAQYEELRAQAAELRKSVAALRAGEGAAGAMIASSAAWVDLNRKVAGAIQAVDQFAASPALVTPAAYDNLNALSREFASSIRDFRQAPRKYLWMKIF